MMSFRQACANRREALLRRARLDQPSLERAHFLELLQEALVLCHIVEVATTDAEALDTLAKLGRSSGRVGAAARRVAAALVPAAAEVELTHPLLALV